jgi:plasmid stability protein
MSESLTIRNLDKKILDRLHAEALQRGTDVADVARDILCRALAVPVVEPPPIRDTLRSLAGTWSAAEMEEFLAAVADFEKIDEDLWK